MASFDDARQRGLSVVLTLEHDRQWRDQDGNVHALEAMEARYLRNVRNWLFKRATGLHFYADLFYATSLSERAPEDLPTLGEEFPDPKEWLAQTPLIVRIRELLEADDYACVMSATNPETIHG